ncbi:hypothetical protein [Streptomyces sp. NPDC056188]|uniref:hypothetical protein n=1 Tax=Streptomyces sp. NPDC056188 TaxID=3345740 RepID=UPI0035DC72DE
MENMIRVIDGLSQLHPDVRILFLFRNLGGLPALLFEAAPFDLAFFSSVESMPTRDRSVPSRFADSAIRPYSRASKTPASRHRRKRLRTFGQASDLDGISRIARRS